MELKDIQHFVLSEIVQHFKQNNYDYLNGILPPEEIPKMREFINSFADLVTNMPSNKVTVEVQRIFAAVMTAFYQGPKSLRRLADDVSESMSPSRNEGLKFIRSIVEDLEFSLKDSQEYLPKKNQEEISDDPELTNFRDENGNRMTISQLIEESEKEKK